MFGDPPILSSEDENKYWQLSRELRYDIKPILFRELIWLRDIVDLTWEILRLRRFKNQLVVIGGRERAAEYVSEVKHEDRNEYKNQEARIQHHTKVMDESRDLFAAHGFGLNLDIMERIEWLLAALEKRRNDTFREIEFHRELAAVRMRMTSDKFIAQDEHTPLAPTGDELAVESKEVVGAAGDDE